MNLELDIPLGMLEHAWNIAKVGISSFLHYRFRLKLKFKLKVKVFPWKNPIAHASHQRFLIHTLDLSNPIFIKMYQDPTSLIKIL